MTGSASDTIVVSGGDAAYFPLVDELRSSLAAAAGSSPLAFGVVDAGLTAAQAEALRAAGCSVERLPELPQLDRRVLQKRPGLAVNLAKPWLDQLFPGFRTIVWLDGDTWVQDFAVIRLLCGAAETGGLAIVPGSGRFRERQSEVRWLLGGIGGLCQMRSFLFKNGRHAGLPQRVLRDIGGRALLNAGVFALPADAPHWRMLRTWQAKILGRGGKPFTSDQMAIALTIYTEGLPVQLLPDTCNYIGPWRVDINAPALVEYYYPYQRVGIVHLAAQRKIRFDPEAIIEIDGIDGRRYALNLRYGHFQRMAAALARQGEPETKRTLAA